MSSRPSGTEFNFLQRFNKSSFDNQTLIASHVIKFIKFSLKTSHLNNGNNLKASLMQIPKSNLSTMVLRSIPKSHIVG